MKAETEEAKIVGSATLQLQGAQDDFDRTADAQATAAAQ
jgi:hypothetical protein